MKRDREKYVPGESVEAEGRIAFERGQIQPPSSIIIGDVRQSGCDETKEVRERRKNEKEDTRRGKMKRGITEGGGKRKKRKEEKKEEKEEKMKG